MTTRTVSQENKIRRRDRWGEMETRNVKTFRNFEAMVGGRDFFLEWEKYRKNGHLPKP